MKLAGFMEGSMTSSLTDSRIEKFCVIIVDDDCIIDYDIN